MRVGFVELETRFECLLLESTETQFDLCLLAGSDKATNRQQRNLSAGEGEWSMRAWADATVGGDGAGKEQSR